MLDAEDSHVTLLGKVIANVKQELMRIGEVAIANGAHVELNRTAGTTATPCFTIWQSVAIMRVIQDSITPLKWAMARQLLETS